MKQFSKGINNTNKAIKYFTDRRDHFIRKARSLAAFPGMQTVYKEKAEVMDKCIERVINRKNRLVESLNLN